MKKTAYIFIASLSIWLGIQALALTQIGAANAAAASSNASSLTRDELEAQVKEKAKQLEAIDKELESTKTNLNTTAAQRRTLQQQINVLNGNIKALNLGIQADTLTAEQLKLEIQTLNYDIEDINNSIGTKRTAIEGILKEFQRNDTMDGNLLALFLKSGSLADGVLEAQNLQNLQVQLATDIETLKDLHDQYNGKLAQSSTKKNQVVAHQQDLQNKKVIVVDQTSEKQGLLTVTKNQESLYQKQLTELQQQQQEIADDIETLDAVLRLKIDPSTLPPLIPGVLLVPVAGDTKANVTQGYGSTAFAKNGYRGKWHNGVDLAASIGTPIFAAEDGTVAASGDQDAYCRKGAYGKFIVVDHTNGLTTLYAHLSRILVLKGTAVKRGQVIGYSGQTGYATGPHLHFTVYAQATFYMGPSKTCGSMPYGGDLNPIGYLF
jgi:murein DD-endopeptidase MepM/ murein hydrolase activator NlpD